MYVETYVGICHTYVRALSAVLTEVIDNGIFYFVSHELRVTEVFGINNCVNGESGLEIENVFPLVVSYGVINFVGCCGIKMFQRFEYAYGSAQRVVCAIHHGGVSCEVNHAPSFLYVLRACFGKLLYQEVFHSLECLGYEFEFLFH